MLGHQERPANVDRHHPVPQRHIDLGEFLLLQRGKQCRVVHQDVDLAELLHRPGNEALHRRFVADVTDHAAGGAAPMPGRDFIGERTAIGNVRDHHLGAGVGERGDVVAADAVRAAGDDRASPGKAAHRTMPTSRRGARTLRRLRAAA